MRIISNDKCIFLMINLSIKQNSTNMALSWFLKFSDGSYSYNHAFQLLPKNTDYDQSALYAPTHVQQHND